MRGGGAFERAPTRFDWELTRTGDLVCRHCRAEAMREPVRDALTTRECRSVCGGSRARAYAATGDFMAEDPLCAYQPALAHRE